VAQDLARDGLTLEALDHQPAAAQPVRLIVAVGQHAGYRDARRSGGPEQGNLPAHPARTRDALAAVLLDDALVARAIGVDQIEGARHTGGSTGDLAQMADLAAEHTPERASHLFGRRTHGAGGHRYPLLDGDDRPPAAVSLMQVLGDAVAG